MNTRTRFGLATLSAVVLGGIAAQSASAATVEYWLRADEFNRNVIQSGTPQVTVPVTVWEYTRCGAGFTAPCTVLNDGGVLRATEGDTVIVHLQNFLRRGTAPITLPNVAAYGGAAVPTSILIPGLPSASFELGATAGSCPTGATSPVEVAGGGRIRSFTSEVPNNTTLSAATGTYCWTNVKAGTYLFQSGTHPAVQVQMGLSGVLVVDGAATGCTTGPRCAYPGVDYDREVVAVFSEIDPAVHAKVADSTYGDAAMSSTVFYEPRYFFLDGQTYDGTTSTTFRSKANVAAGAPNEKILIRMVNAGIEAHTPLLNGERFRMIAEDGSPYAADTSLHPQYSTLLAAGKTLDVLMTPAQAGSYVLFDRQRGLANNGGGAGGVAASGMLVSLVIAVPGP